MKSIYATDGDRESNEIIEGMTSVWGPPVLGSRVLLVVDHDAFGPTLYEFEQIAPETLRPYMTLHLGSLDYDIGGAVIPESADRYIDQCGLTVVGR